VSLDPLKCTFWRYYISALRGCCALKFLHALEIDKGYLAHPQLGRGSPQKILIGEHEKSGLKFNVLRSITSGLVGVSSRDFFQSTLRYAGVIIWVQFLQGPPPKICDRQKIVQNFSRFLATFEFDREYLRNAATNRKSELLLKIYNPCHVGRKKVCVLWSTKEKVIELNKFTP